MKDQQNPAAYIYERKSIRQYLSQPVGADVINQICKWPHEVQGLEPSHHFFVEIHDFDLRDERSRAIGGFGRLISPPHYLVPYIIGGMHALTDLGFRTQQIVLELWRQGIGTCYIGCVQNQKKVKSVFGLPLQACVGAFIAFGIPDQNETHRLLRSISHLFTQSHRRAPLQDLFLDSSYQRLENYSSILYQLLEAGRYAPSAMNAQPWRFNIEEELEVFAKINHGNRIYDLEQNYPLHDVGICMANMNIAARELGRRLKWELAPVLREKTISGQRVIRIAELPIKAFKEIN